MAFNFFQFWKKEEAKSKIPISKIPLFATLGPQELALIEDKIRLVEYKKNDIVYRAGEEPEAFYIILSGRFRVVGLKGKTLITLSQGDYFGESSILLGRTHSATIEAKNDGLVLRIAKNDFLHLLNEIPSLSLHLGRTLGHRLTLGPKSREVADTKIISIASFELEADRNMFVSNLAAMLFRNGQKKTMLVSLGVASDNKYLPLGKGVFSLMNLAVSDFEQLKKIIEETAAGYHAINLRSEPEEADPEKQIASLITFLAEQYDFVILNLPHVFGEIGVKALQQSDLVYYLVPDTERRSAGVRSAIHEFKSAFGFTPDKIRMLLFETSDGVDVYHSAGRLDEEDEHDIFHRIPFEAQLSQTFSSENQFVLSVPDSPYTKAVRFLSRELTGSLVGLALGSGAAFGFAHIGVFRALERENIPVDIITGSSIGALVGAMWAAGLHSKDMEEMAMSLTQKNIFFKLIGFSDFSLPHHGFFKGNQIVNFLRTYLGNRTFRSLQVPLKIVAANLFTGEEVVMDEGDVVDAIRASISIPGIFRPVQWRDQNLIDGGVVDPLPVKVLSRYGVKKIIAVNVLSAPEEHVRRRAYYEARKQEFERTEAKKNMAMRIWIHIRDRLLKRYRPNIFNVLMNTIQFLEYGIAESSATGADILIRPVLTNSHWAEFYSPAKFIQIGEQKTMEQMAEIKKLVNEKAESLV